MRKKLELVTVDILSFSGMGFVLDVLRCAICLLECALALAGSKTLINAHNPRCVNNVSIINEQSCRLIIKMRIRSNILGGAIGSAFGC